MTVVTRVTPNVRGALDSLEAFLASEAPAFQKSPSLAQAAAKISVGYTETRVIDDDAAASVAYLAHFGPRAVVAVSRSIAALPPGHLFDHVVDVGAGSGASALAWAAAGAQRITLIDRSEKALALAKRMLAAVAPSCRVEVRRGHFDEAVISSVPEATHVSAAFVLGELASLAGDRAGSADDDDDSDGTRCLAMLKRVAPRARAVVVVDAGDRPRARRVQRLRDAAVVDGKVVFGPCGHRDPCPALLRERDWCHDRFEKALPPGLSAFASLVGRDPALMSATWLAYGDGADGAHDIDVADDSAGDDVVVLGTPRVEKGRVRVPVCGPGGNRFVQVLKRHKDLYQAASALPRGARVSRSLLPPGAGELVAVTEPSPALTAAFLAAASDANAANDDADGGQDGDQPGPSS